MKNSRRSDRELAKALKVSQPTITRTRGRLEKEGYVREFTIIPDFQKLGFQLVAFVLIRMKKSLTAEEYKKAQETATKDIAEKAPDEIVLFERGMGAGYDGVMVSFHKSYSDYRKLLDRIKEYPFVDIAATLSFLVDLTDKTQYRYFTFSTLAKHLMTIQKPTEK